MSYRNLAIVVILVACACPGALAQESGPKTTPELITASIVEHPETKQLDQEGPGKLYQVGEHLVCVMEGTPEEMGFQHGRMLAKQIEHIIKEGYILKALYRGGYTREYINAQSERMEKHFPPEYIEEMHGIVKGLKAAKVNDIAYEYIRTAVTQAEISHYRPGMPPDMKPEPPKEVPKSCSNFAVWGKWTPDGRLLHGRNLDWNIVDGAQDNAVILVWRPKGKTPFMMVGWTGGIGSVSGMNAQGITIGEMTSVSADETFDGLPLFLIIRRVLDSAGTLDEAVRIMQQGPRTTGWNFIIGDAKIPDARALEVDAVDCTVFAPMDPKETEETGHWAMEDAVRRTNHPIGFAQLRKLAMRYGKYANVDPNNLQASIPWGKLQNTWQRYDWLGKQIQAHPKGVDIPQALQMLVNRPVGGETTDTLHSWVFDPKNKTIYVAIAGSNPPVPATRRPYTKIDLTAWFQ
jgi:predicted choloylglycine hydrolase